MKERPQRVASQPALPVHGLEKLHRATDGKAVVERRLVLDVRSDHAEREGLQARNGAGLEARG
eukprot:scaffold98684_cov82-Phaeocystis_antarctica.AAC.3